MCDIPDFTDRGLLPVGIHATSWAVFVDRFGTNDCRREQLGGLRMGMELLRHAGCRRVYVDGSFVTRKQYPNDYDVCYETAGMDLSKLDVVIRVPESRRDQKLFLKGEYFPRWHENHDMLDFYRQHRPENLGAILSIFMRNLRGAPKGVVALALEPS